MIEGIIEELKGFKTIGMGCEKVTKNILHKTGGKNLRWDVLEKSWLKWLIRIRMVVNYSGDRINFNVGF
ncbi:hypothetical protein COP2_029648 [Malus domestica]